LSPDSAISIPYAAIYSFLKDAECDYQEMKGLDGSDLEEELPPTHTIVQQGAAT
jgi:hypothetical protein